MLVPALVLGSVGGSVAVMLVIAARVFRVEGAEQVEAVAEQLPGANCGACGFPGCLSYAEAIVNDGVEPDKCVPGGPDIIPKIHAVMGDGEWAHAEAAAGTADVVAAHPWPVRSEAYIRRIAFVACGGGNEVGHRYDYVGLMTCGAANQVGGGFKDCYAACLGLGDCQRACPFGAIDVLDGLAVVNPDLCTGCSLCVSACPKQLISLVPVDAPVLVRCSNRLKGRAVSSVCKVGCIACNKCERTCPGEAIKMRNNLPEVDVEKCTSEAAGVIAECPTETLVAGPMAAYRAGLRVLVAVGAPGESAEEAPAGGTAASESGAGEAAVEGESFPPKSP